MNDKNLLTIGEIAKSIGITRKIILNYEAKGLIAPDVKEGSVGNRYYTIDTFTKIRTIRVFQDLGLSLDEIKLYFDGGKELNSIIKRLEKMRDELNLTIEKLKERVNKNEEISEIVIDPQTVYVRTYNAESIADKTNLLRDTAIEAMKLHGTDTTRRMYFIQFSIEDPSNVSYCVAVPPESEGELVTHEGRIKALSYFHHGAYENIPDARNKLIQYAKENNIKLTGTFRNVFLEGPPQHKDKSRFITQIIALTE